MNHNKKIACGIVLLVAAAVPAVAGPWHMDDGRAPTPKKEADLLAVLRSNGPKAKKADACKDLAVYGSSAAIPDLAKLLGDEHLASWARIAIEAIPGPASDEALRNSLPSLHGQLLVGVINSIGVRRDASSVGALTGRLGDRDVDVASAAAVALGHIGNEPAAKALEQSLVAAAGGKKVRSAVAEGLVLCAERCLADGRDARAVALYDAVRKADVRRQRILEATRGAILARRDNGIPLLIEQFRSPDKDFLQIALMTAREFPGSQVDQALADEIERAKPERGALLIGAMADRKETVLLAAVVKAAGHGPKLVRLAAAAALGRVGNESCLPVLLESALDGDAELAEAAKAALADVPGAGVDKEIVARLANAQGKMYPLLLEVIGDRRIQAVAELEKALESSDDVVRSAALTSLGTTVPAGKLSILIGQVVSPKHEQDTPIAEKALKRAAVRMADREACAAELAAALERSTVPTKVALLKILAAVGGTKSLAAIGAAAKSSDEELDDTASRLLGSWMTADVAPVLLDLAKTGPSEKYRVRALRGYLRVARQFAISDKERVEICQNALGVANQLAEKKLVLDALKRHPSLEALKLTAKITRDIPKLNKEATEATLAIAQKLSDKKSGANLDDVRKVLSSAHLGKVKVEIVKAEYGAGPKQKDVTKTLQKLVAGLPLIVLKSPTYTAVFGGDPVPGTPKKLTVQYRIDGKPGEASFAENSLVILPMPK